MQRMNIRMAVACFNTEGEPDFFLCVVEASSSEFAAGTHYDRATAMAADQGYLPPMVAFDSWDNKHGRLMPKALDWMDAIPTQHH